MGMVTAWYPWELMALFACGKLLTGREVVLP